jgi:nucleotide-binding universal stress UspA family protein
VKSGEPGLIHKEEQMPNSKTGIKRIVVGVDGSPQSEAALRWAVRMAKGMGSQVIAVYAVDVPVYFPQPYGIPVQFDEKWHAAMKSEFEEKWCEPLKVSGVRYRTVMEDGHAASVVGEVADRENADVIVVGRRGRSGVKELLLGSVSHALVLHSKLPVLVISQPD